MRTSVSTVLSFVAGAGLMTTSMLAFDADNAHKVDGKHAVGASASAQARKGKLVSTSPKTGRLPSNIIAVAPDSSRLGGKLPAAYRTISLPAQAAYFTGTASQAGIAAELPAAGAGAAGWSLVIPPSYRGWPDPFHADLVFGESSAGACSIALQGISAYGPDAAGGSHTGSWAIPGGGLVEVPAGSASYHRLRVTWTPEAGSLPEAGMFVGLTLRREGDALADSCSDMRVIGAQVTF